jgi:hypothetical protein
MYNCSIAVSAAAPLTPITPWAYDLQVTAKADGNWSTLVQVFASPDNNVQDNVRQCYAIIRTGTQHCSAVRASTHTTLYHALSAKPLNEQLFAHIGLA